MRPSESHSPLRDDPSRATPANGIGLHPFSEDVQLVGSADRVLAETAARQEAENYRRLVANLPDALLVHDGQTLLFANPAADRMFAAGDPAKLRGIPILSLVEPIHHERVKRRFRDILEGGGLAPLAEVRLFRLNGEPFDAEATGTLSMFGNRRVIQAVIRDVTERKRAQLALVENEQRFRVALENSRIVVFNQDADLRYTWIFNPQLGMKVSDVIGKTDQELFDPEDAAALLEIKRRVMQTGKGVRKEIRIKSPSGERAFDLVVEPLNNADGGVVGITCAAADVTMTRAAHEELQRQKELLQRVFDHIPVMVCVIDSQDRIVMVNREWHRIMGWEPREFNTAEIWEKIYPDPAYRRFALTSIRESAGRWGDFRCLDRDGRIVDTSWANVGLSDGSSIGIGQDVTERKRAEAALRESEERFRHLADQVPVTIWMSAPEAGCTYVSKQWLELTGSTEKDNLGDGWAKFVHPEDAKRMRAGRDADSKTHEVTRAEFRVRRRDGTWRWMMYHGVPRFGSDGTFMGYVGTTVDISDLKNSQQLIEFQRHVLRRIATGGGLQSVLDELCCQTEKLIPGAACGVLLRDERDQRLHFRSFPNVSMSIRRQLDDLKALRQWPVEYAAFNLPNSEYAGCVYPIVSEAQIPLGAIVLLFNRARTPDALEQLVTRTAVELAAISLHHAAAESALRESERTMRTLLGNLRGMAYRCRNEPSWAMEFVSSGCHELTGYRAERLVGKDSVPYGDLIHPEDCGWIWQAVQEALRSHVPFQLEYRLRTADGREKWVWEQGCGVYEEDGTLRFLEGYITDITARKQIEQDARQRYAEVAHALRVSSIGEMAGSIAHELNQPLAAIVNYCNGSLIRLTRGALAGDQLHEALRKISTQAERAGQILHRVNRFVRKEEPARGVVDLHELIGSALELISSELRRAKVHPKLELDAQNSRIYVDGIQIEQVLVNLGRNAGEAMKTTAPDQRRLTIRTRSTGDEVETVVIDTGAGCPPETLRRLFEPFFSTKPQGMGLGLSICKSIIEAHGGRVWAAPNPGAGMAFHFILPLYRGE